MCLNSVVLMLLMCVQRTTFNNQHAAAGKLLDLVSAKLDGYDRTSFDQLVYALVQTEQLNCAKMLDDELTEIYLQDQGPEHGLWFTT